MIRRVCALLFLVVVAGVGIRQTPASRAMADPFKEKVLPIFEQNCLSCHGAKLQRSGLDLRTEDSVLKGGARGASIVPGNPEKSLLYRLVTHKEEPEMPMGGKLGDAEIAVIAEWIRQLQPKALAVNNAANNAAGNDSAPVRSQGYSITDKDRQFWAFVKPIRPTPPASLTVKERAWVKNEIDAFVLAKFKEKGLQPSPAAAPRELLRRVYFDLIGLPPTPAEMDAFLKNPSENAYQQVIEKLLASPQYGERWGRHWLDLARYADSGGYEFDY
ncbi:MAG TPA: DUF1549 domain-containing protein, partial [Blastocatellia bacterium]|nr:DUF1549 domain-containing protein [Blastocatellia bacterium]